MKGTKTTKAEALILHKEFINSASQKARKKGEFYAKSKIKLFNDDLKVFHWWKIMDILELISQLFG